MIRTVHVERDSLRHSRQIRRFAAAEETIPDDTAIDVSAPVPRDESFSGAQQLFRKVEPRRLRKFIPVNPLPVVVLMQTKTAGETHLADGLPPRPDVRKVF